MTDEISQQAADDADLAAVLDSLDQLSVEETPEPEFSEAQETLISPVLENLREGVVRPSPGAYARVARTRFGRTSRNRGRSSATAGSCSLT